MGEVIGADIGAFGHASVKIGGGKLSVGAEISVDKLVDLVIDAAEKAVPGDYDKLLLEPVRLAAKTYLSQA